jgi:hypothetical protein
MGQKTLKNTLIAKYHVLAKELTDDERYCLLMGNFKVDSSSKLSVTQLIDLVRMLEGKSNPDAEADKYRKRVIAAIGAWLRVTNQPENIAHITGIACRAASAENFNKIPPSKLRAIYHEFSNKARVAKEAKEVKAMEIARLELSN